MNSLVILITLITAIHGSEKAYNLNTNCDIEENDYTSNRISSIRDNLVDALNSVKETNSLKGFEGTIGVVGGSTNLAGAIYFSGITILKLGIDEVKIFCDEETAKILKRFSPDLSVYSTLENIGVTLRHLETVDVVLLGPGMEHTTKNVGTVIPKVVEFCKKHKKPLIIDLDERFLTTEIVNTLLKYPESGVILTPNNEEFMKIYKAMKKLGITNDNKIELDEDKFGSNIYILRKGCLDAGISTNKNASWVSLTSGSTKRSNSQGHILSGAVAAYYFWTLKHMEITTAIEEGPMFQAGVATFTASYFVRMCNEKAYEKMRGGMITSDMVDNMYATMQDF